MLKRGAPLQRKGGGLRKSGKSQEKKDQEAEQRRKLHEWFFQVWDQREDSNGYCYCFETGIRMPRGLYRDNLAVYDHVLEKNNGAFPQYKFTKKNIVIVLPYIHNAKGTNIELTSKILEYKNYLLDLHKEGKLIDGE